MVQAVFRSICALGIILAAAAAHAEAPVISAAEAAEQVARGEIVLLDIRTEAEWKETGLAKGAWPVSMHTKAFASELQAILGAHEPASIALICATGGRTQFVTQILAKNGVTGIIDVSEGMAGNSRGPGWVARGLPVVPVEEAMRAYRAKFPQN